MSKPSDNPRKALGKGLSALLPARNPLPTPTAQAPAEQQQPLLTVPIDKIDPNPLQPRSTFQAERLSELAQSIKENGIIQPLVVRLQGDRYQLIAGERRWRASKLAGLQKVPVVVQDFPDDRLLEVTLIENIQREDLNPIEVAQAFDRLSKELNLNHDDIGRRTGKDRATVTNMLRLLRLPKEIQQLLIDRRLSMGHARAILGLPTHELQLQVAEKASSQSLSVRQVEHLIQKMTKGREAKSADEVRQDPNVRAAIDELERILGTRVRIVEKSEKRGRIEIEYYSPQDLDRLYSQIVGLSDNS